MRGPAFIVREYAQLGNTLHTFVNAAALAVESNRVLVNLIFHPYAQFFAGTAHTPIVCYPPEKRFFAETLALAVGPNRLRRLLYSKKWCRRLLPFVVTYSESDFLEVREGHLPLQQAARDPRAIVVDAWNLHLPRLVELHAEKLRAYFALSPLWLKKLEDWFALAPRPKILVGVHIRRFGENYGPGERWYRSDEFYLKRMREMSAALGPDTGFLICSDGPVDLANYADFPVRLGPNDRILDLYALSRCDWIFGPYSTFSAWSSWVGQVPRHEVDEDVPLDLAKFRIHRFD